MNGGEAMSRLRLNATRVLSRFFLGGADTDFETVFSSLSFGFSGR